MNKIQSKDKKQLLKVLIEKLEQNSKELPLANEPSDIIPPEGNPDAELMFIGEAAGYHEHLQRRPFVGVAGKLLSKIFEEVGIKREDVWISNILKVRPPRNRDPLDEEIEAYRSYLDQEIQLIKPKIIITLGRFSMAKFLPNTYISKVHGQARWIDWQGDRLLVFPMYHPAAALRNGQVMKLFKEDFEKLDKIIKTLNNQSNADDDQENLEKGDKPRKDIDQQLKLI
jgi:DNA polymerase